MLRKLTEKRISHRREIPEGERQRQREATAADNSRSAFSAAAALRPPRSATRKLPTAAAAEAAADANCPVRLRIELLYDSNIVGIPRHLFVSLMSVWMQRGAAAYLAIC